MYPRISLKFATSLDGKIALSNGKSKWITSEAARQMGRSLRGDHDAILIGSNTAIQDDPLLTARTEGKSDPVRIVLDRRLRLSPASKLAETAHQSPVWVYTENISEKDSKPLKNKGIVVRTDCDDLPAIIADIYANGVRSVLIEGGGMVAASFLKAGLVDRIYWFRAPMVIGGDGRNCIAPMMINDLDNAVRFKRLSIEEVDCDILEILEPLS